MHRIVLYLTLGLLVLAAGFFAFRRLTAEEPLAMSPLSPALPRSQPAEATAAAQGSVNVDTNERATEPPAADDDRVARLEVRVVSTLGSAPPVAVPFRDVDLVVAGGETIPMRQRTDATGIARFDVAGGHGRTAHVRAAQTAKVTVQLRGDAVVQSTLTIAARMQVQGRILDESGTGIANADLVLLPWIDPEHHAPRTRYVGRSAADGSFLVWLGAGGQLGAEHPGYGPSPMFLIPPAADPTEPPVRHTLHLTLLSRHATVEARVRDPRGRPVSGAELELRAFGNAPAGATLPAPPVRAHTDDNGMVTIRGLRPGDLEFAVRAKGHAGARGKTRCMAGRATVLEIALPASGEVHGFVETMDGVRVAGARIWSGAASDFASVSTTSDAEGAFRLEHMPVGTHELTAREGSSWIPVPGARRARTQMQVVPGEVTHWLAVLEPALDSTALRGEVVDTSDRPLAGWRVVARAGGRLASARTDATGTFAVERPAATACDLLVYAPETPPGAFASAVRLAVDGDGAPLRIVVDLAAPVATMVARVVTSEQAPLAATFACYHHERRETVQFRARDDGTLAVPRVPPGTLDVYIEHPGYAPTAQKRLEVRAHTPVDLGLVVLGAAAALHGTVTGPGRSLPEQLEITLLTKGRRLTAEYTAGTYRFAAAPPGQHVMQVQGPGVCATNFVVQLSAGVDREQDIELRAGVPRRILVLAPAAAGPVVSIAIRRPDEAHTWNGAAHVQPGAPGSSHGTAEFTAWMAPGTYEVVAWTPSPWEGRAQVTFVLGDDSPVSIELHPE